MYYLIVVHNKEDILDTLEKKLIWIVFFLIQHEFDGDIS